MKTRLTALCLLLVLLALPAHAQETLVNRITDAGNPFSFKADAELLHIYFPRIAGCDAALVRYGDFSALIDGATPDQADAVLTMLKRAGVTRLTYAINSHPDPDHMGGFKNIFSKVPADKMIVGFPETGLADDENQKFETMLYKWMDDMQIPIERMDDGDALPLGDATISLLQFYDQNVPGINNSSLMCMVSLGARSAFFTGDIQLEAQQKLVKSGAKIAADILKFSHHGYRRANEGFLKAVNPAVCVLTGGFASCEAAREQLGALKTYFLTTDRGILHFSTDGETWVLERLQ